MKFQKNVAKEPYMKGVVKKCEWKSLKRNSNAKFMKLLKKLRLLEHHQEDIPK